jgi:hypothetical protein
MTTSPGPSALAGFAIDDKTYWVNRDGKLESWTPRSGPLPDGAQQIDCVAGDQWVSVGASESDRTGKAEYTGGVWVQRIGRDEAPQPLGAVPSEIHPGAMVCAAGRVSFGDQGTEGVLNLESGSWSTSPTNLAELTGGFISPISGRMAGATDRAAVFVQGSNSAIIRRIGDGAWEPTGASGHVFPTGAEVLVVADDGTVTAVWPT